MPNALIIGAGGFLGRHLTRRLLRENWSVSTLRFAGRTARIALPGENALEAAAYTADAIGAALPDLQWDAVYLLAAAGVDPSQRSPHQLLQANIQLPQILIEALQGRPVSRIILTGTCSEYFPLAPGRLSEETDAIEGADTYGASKAAGALWAMRLALQLNVPLTHLRLFHFYGPGEAPYRLISSLFRQLNEAKPVPLSPGEQYRDLLYIEDVLDALESAPKAEPGRTYNVCSGRPVTVAEVGRTAARVLGQPEDLLRFGDLNYRPGEVMWIAGNNERFMKASGWSPRWPLEEGLKDMRIQQTEAPQ